MVEEGKEEEGDGVRAGLPALLGGQRRHDLSAGAAQELGDGHDLVAAGAQGLNHDGQGGDRGGAVAAAVMHEDNGAAAVGVGLHGGDLVEDGLGDFSR